MFSETYWQERLHATIDSAHMYAPSLAALSTALGCQVFV